MHMPCWEFVMTDNPDLGRILDHAGHSAWDAPCGGTWSSSDPFGI
jgi:hypothetical protein